MYLLDTHVISELRRSGSKRIDPGVSIWSESVEASSLFLSSITILELELGILLVERRDSVQGQLLRSWMNDHVLPAFTERVLSVDLPVAQCAAGLNVPDPKPQHDTLIAATAKVHGMIVVTRNVNDFNAAGVEVINPWEYDGSQ